MRLRRAHRPHARLEVSAHRRRGTANPALDRARPRPGRRHRPDGERLHHLDRAATPLLLLVGDHAPRHEAWQAEMMYAGLQRLHRPVALVSYPGEDHVFAHADHVRDAWERVLAWLGRWLTTPGA